MARATVALPDEEGAETPTCELCEGELVEMGTLGRRKHFRCRGCGMESSKEVVDDDED